MVFRSPGSGATAPRGGGRPPPTMTMPLHVPGDRPPPRRQALILRIVLLLGLGAGFTAAQLVGSDMPKVPDENLVLYQNATSGFPVEGAGFTRSAFDSTKGKGDKAVLKDAL